MARSLPQGARCILSPLQPCGVALGSLAFEGPATCPGSPRKWPSEPWPRGWAAKQDHLGPGPAPGPGPRLLGWSAASRSQLPSWEQPCPICRVAVGSGERGQEPGCQGSSTHAHPLPGNRPESLGRPETLPPAQVTEKARLPPHSGRATLQQPRALETLPGTLSLGACGVQIVSRLENPR